MALIFDLDQTLIDSKSIEHLRSERNWQEVYKLIPTLKPYEGINQLLTELSNANIPFGIVTSSPSPYCKRIINHWKWQPSVIVCYHDTKKRKPHPDPYLKAIESIGIEPSYVYAIGDNPIDMEAAKAACTKSIAVTWGVDNTIDLINSNPDFLFNEVKDLRKFIHNIYPSVKKKT